MVKYRISVSIDEQNFFWIVIDNGRFIRNPAKEDLNGTKIRCYNMTNICSRCREENIITDKSILYPKNACREKDKEGKETGKWICINCYKKDDYLERYICNSRTGNLKPGSNKEKGNKSQKLINILENFDDLNKKNNNFNSLIDSIDPITGLKYQIQGRSYDSMRRRWDFGKLEVEWYKNFVSIFLVCFSKDWNIVERIYIIPKGEIKYKRTNISIYKYDSNGLPYEWGWYEQYRKNEEYINKANEIWNEII